MRSNDTRTNPFGGRDSLSPSNMTRIGNGLRFTAVSAIPVSETDGVPVQDWTSVHVIFYADTATYAGLVGTFRPWRWYSKQPEGQSGASGTEVGRWIPDFEITAALDPTMISPTISSHYVWDTRGAEKMFWQLTGVLDADGNPGVVPDWVIVQPFGYSNPEDCVGIAVSSAVSGSGTIDVNVDGVDGLGVVKATHWSPANGTVAYTAGTQVTCAGFPFVVDDANCTVLGIIVRHNTNVVHQLINGIDGISITAVNNLLTVSGAPLPPFAATDLDYYVYLLYEEKAYDDTVDAYRTQEIAPLNTIYTQPAYIVNRPNVTVDPGLSYAPDVNGIIIDDYCDICFHLYMVGGLQGGGGPSVLTCHFEGSNDNEPGGVRQWVDLGVGYDLTNDGTIATLTASGATPVNYLIDFDNWVQRRIRLVYDWDSDPGGVTPGSLIVTTRRKALGS